MRLIDLHKIPRRAFVSDRDDLVDALLSAPTIDAIPVVRCGDCIHYEMGVCLKIYDDGAANKDAWQERNQNDFCSYGERRDETEAQK